MNYAILETSGDLTVTVKPELCPVNRQDLHLECPAQFYGMPLTLIDDGEINWKGMDDNGLTEKWLMEKLAQYEIENAAQIFFASLSCDGTFYIITREEALCTREKIH